MKSEIITIGTESFLYSELVEVLQKEKSFFLAKVSADKFLNMYTVRPAQYDLKKHTELANSFPDDAEYFKHLINQDKKNLEKQDFQRDPNEDRINRIAKFLDNEEYAFFPNSIIANCELINDWEDYSIDEDSSVEDFIAVKNRPKYLSFLKKDGESYYLYTPNIQNSILVIDGQHRLEGLKKTKSGVASDYDLIVVFIIGFDRSVIAKQFYTINYEQKAVNKSLLYQLTGEFTIEVDELTFMHNIVKLLNETPDSPFYGRVKMLGKAPKNLSKEQKQMLSISQAFLIDALIRYISETAAGSIYPPIFLRYYKNTEEHIYIVRAIARFFNAVLAIKPEWNDPSKSLLSKGMGIGALIKTFNLLFPIIFKKELNNDWDKIKDLTIANYTTILSGLENIDFSTDGPYGKTGSAGSINKIKEDIIASLNYIDKPASFSIFEDIYKNDFLPNFNTALQLIIKK
jgi:DGQHR domain-containing protein